MSKWMDIRMRNDARIALAAAADAAQSSRNKRKDDYYEEDCGCGRRCRCEGGY